MKESPEKSVTYLEKQNMVAVFDRVYKKRLFLRNWEKMGRGNTAISMMDGTSLDQSYVVFSSKNSWYYVKVDDASGITFKKIKEENKEKQGPLFWLSNDTKSNW